MKHKQLDRHGNEWVMVPVKLLPQMAEAIHYGPNSADDAPTLNDVQFWGECWDAAIAAAPKFEPVEVDDAMCHRVYTDYCTRVDAASVNPVIDGADMIAAVRSELGPALGLVEIREPSDEQCRDIWRDAKANEGDGSKVCAGRAMFTAVSKWLKGEL